MSTAPQAAWNASHALGCGLDTPAAARAFVATQLARNEASVAQSVRDDVALVVSELTTNAVAVARGDVTLELARYAGELLVAVRDDGPGWPTPVAAQVDDVHGRGLTIVAGIARDWGIEKVGNGKRVWARVAM